MNTFTIRTRVYGGAFIATCQRKTSSSTNAERLAVEATALKLFGLSALSFERSGIKVQCRKPCDTCGRGNGEWVATREAKR